MSDPPVLDVGHLETMTGGDAKLAEEVLGLFRQQVETWRRMLDPMQEPAMWADAAHAIKGAARGVGALALGAACERCEKIGRETPPPGRQRAAAAVGLVKEEIEPALVAADAAAHALLVSGTFSEARKRSHSANS